MSRKQRGWLAIVTGALGLLLSGWLFLWGVKEVSHLPAMGECGYGETVNPKTGECE